MRVIQIPLNGGRRLIGINKKDRRRWRVKKNLHKLKNIYTPLPLANPSTSPGVIPDFLPLSLFHTHCWKVEKREISLYVFPL